jgi:hypothetical protein
VPISKAHADALAIGQRRRRRMEAGQMMIDEVQQIVAGHMDDILKCFKAGTKIAVLCRTPGFPERDFVMTDDDLSELSAMIDRRKADGS